MFDFIIIGSGPSGILAAQEVLKNNKSVLMLDIGEQQSSRSEEIKNFAINNAEHELPEIMLSKYSTELNGSLGGKNLFGDQVLNLWKKYWDIQFSNSAPIGPSTLEGGYSKIWGASCMPPELLLKLSSHNIDSKSKLDVQEIVNFLGMKQPSEIVPNNFMHKLANLSAASRFERRYSNNRVVKDNAPFKDNLQFSPSYISTSKLNGKKCNGCRSCLIGCHADVLFTSSEILHQLKKQYASFQYLNNKICIHVEETATEAKVTCIDNETLKNYLTQFKARKILLAAGPLASTEIIANSLKITKKIKILTSQLVTFGMISTRLGDIFNGSKRKQMGLSEYFIFNQGESRPDFFLQLYSSNQILQNYITPHWLTNRPVNFAFRQFEQLLVACQGFLDSTHSPDLFFQKRQSNEKSVIHGGVFNNKAILKLIRQAVKVPGYITTPVMPQLPGSGYHLGGSFPKKSLNNEFFSDDLGRPQGLINIHLVDASILPFIPAGPFTSYSLLNTLRVVKAILVK